MKNKSNEMSTGAALLLTLGIMLFIGWIVGAFEPKCCMSGCDNEAKEGERYCYLHDLSYRTYGNPDYTALYKESKEKRESYSSESTSKSGSTNITEQSKKGTTSQSSTSSSSKKYNSYNAYDEGYEDVYDNDDYDWDRYWSDSDYANGVDDAMEDLDW